MAGYTGDRLPPMQKRMIDAVATIPGVESVGLTDALLLNDANPSNVFTDETTDLRPSNAAASALHVPRISRIPPRGGHYLAGRPSFHLARRQKFATRGRGESRVRAQNLWLVTRRNRQLLQDAGWNPHTGGGCRRRRKILRASPKIRTRRCFPPILQWPSGADWLVVRSSRDPHQLGAAIRGTLRQFDAALPVTIETRYDEMVTVLFPAQMATVSLGVMGVMGAMLSITGIFGMAAYSVSKRLRELGIRVALGAQRKQVLEAALGRAFKLLAFGSTAGLLLGLLASRVLAFVVYQATPRDPLVLAAVVVAMALLGLLATWIPARRALSVDPMILLREE